MHRTVVKCTDKHVSAALFRLFFESQTLQKNNHITKRRFPLLTFQNNFTNIFNNILESHILSDDNPYAEVKQYLKENSSRKCVAARTLMDIFSLDRKEAKYILDDNAKLQEMTKKSLLSSYELLKNHGLTVKLIQDNIVLLTEDHNILKKKVNIVSQLTNNIAYAIPLLYHDLNILNSFINTYNRISGNSIQKQILLIQQKLQITNQEVFFIISKYLYYIMYLPDQTIQKLTLLMDYGVSVNSLIDLNWPLVVNYEEMKARLQLYKDELISPIKPWMLIKNQIHIDKRIEILHTKSVAPYKFWLLIDFLSKKTGYKTEVIKFRLFNSTHKRLLPYEKSMDKIGIIIKEGYDYHDIVWSIRVLTVPENVIIQRFSALQAVNRKEPFLNVLLLSNRDFVKYVNSKKILN